MEINLTNKTRPSDYSLTGKDSALAVEKGLAEAKWYASPVAKEKMRELLERRDGPALRDTLLWFALIGFFGALRFPALGQRLGRPPLCGLRRALRIHIRLALARIQPRDGIQNRLAEQRAV